MNFIRLFLILTLGFMTSCTKRYYKPDQIEIIAKGYTDEGMVIEFKPPVESMYYCPGLKLEYEDDVIRYRFVRSGINDSPEVDARANEHNDRLRVLIPIPEGQRRIELVNEAGGTSKWEITPAE